jgi:hypothetical protein
MIIECWPVMILRRIPSYEQVKTVNCPKSFLVLFPIRKSVNRFLKLNTVLLYNAEQFEFTRFEVLTSVNISIKVFWDISPCSLVDRYQSFGGAVCLHLQSIRVFIKNLFCTVSCKARKVEWRHYTRSAHWLLCTSEQSEVFWFCRVYMLSFIEMGSLSGIVVSSGM